MSKRQLSTIKMMIRHMLLRAGLEDTRLFINRLRGVRKIDHLRVTDLGDRFSAIYRSDAWLAAAGQESLSGPGSTSEATEELGKRLSNLLKNLNCQHLVDLGCGDFNWMKNVSGSFSYTGLDIVPEVIQRNSETFSQPTRRFLCHDATRDQIPSCDTVLCREVLFHLSFNHARQVLDNVILSGAEYFITTTDDSVFFNADIRSGDFRPLNLLKSPFRLPPPDSVLQDGYVSPSRVLGLWKIRSLATFKNW